MKARLLALVIFITCSLDGSASSRSQRARGALIFSASGCTHCHSIRGTGGKRGPDLSGVGRKMKEAQMRKQIVDGSNRMPPFGNGLQEKEVKDLIAYLRSCRDK
jgi:ubiquinol-cytochrome c reductase cytochrome b subunit